MDPMHDIELVKQLRIDIANDPEKFTSWEDTFIDSLVVQMERNKLTFLLTPRQREACEQIQDKANQ